MKSRTAFEQTVRKMERSGRKLYFWTFTFRDVHSLRFAMRLWNEFLTILKRKIAFRGVRVLELHDEHGAHLHVVTNKRYKIRTILGLGDRYGFGRTHVERVTDVAGGIAYLCKYLSKKRPPCLKSVRLWAAFGDVERTRVCDIICDSPFIRVLRKVMGRPSPEDLLSGSGLEVNRKRAREGNFLKALPIAWEDYFAEFDPEHIQRQRVWEARRFEGLCELSTRWFGAMPVFEGPSKSGLCSRRRRS
jgi:hypothetical protein